MNHPEQATDPSNRRLDSWKEIATFFGRDERTVRRWEKDRSLPVYRMPGKTRGSVYAFTNELSQWLKTPNFPADEIEADLPDSGTVLVASEDAPSVIGAPSGKIPSWAFVVAVVVVLGVVAAWLVHLRVSALSAAKTHSAAHTPNPEALDLYLKGRYEWSKRTPDSLNKAVDDFTQAIVHDSNYAQAYAGLADTYDLLREYTSMPSDEAYPRAIAAAKKAVELDDSLSEAHRALAFATFYWTWDFQGGEREFQRAIQLDPKDAVAHHWYGTALLSIGRSSEALSQIEQARQLDPTSASISADRAYILFFSHREAEGIAMLKQLEAADPAFVSPHRYMAEIALVQKDYPAYLTESRKTAELTHDAPALEISKAASKAYAAGGAKAMLVSIRQLQIKYYGEGSVSGSDVARTCALLGKNDEAIYYLQEDVRKHEPGIVGVRSDPLLLSLHNDPAFADLVSRIGLPPAQ